MITKRIRFNCDVGEGIGNEAEIMPFLEYCSIACGAHAGNETTMREVVKLAKSHNVKIGAHPSYPDRENFGRVELKISNEELLESLNNQILALQTICDEESSSIDYVKFHGALYNKAMKDDDLARLLTEFLSREFPEFSLFVLPNSMLEREARKCGIECFREAFADRGYNPDGSLIPRSETGAVLTNTVEVWNQLRFYLESGNLPNVISEDPSAIDTFCLHGDHPQTPSILKEIAARLEDYDFQS